MKRMTVRSMFLFMLSTKVLTEDIDTNNYFQLISDVHKYYHTSCIFFVQPDSYHNLNLTTLHTWSRKFSRQRVMTVTITFSDLVSEYNRYRNTIVSPLFVVLLDTGEAMSEFVNATRNIKPMSFPVWFVIFLQHPGNPLEEYCGRPKDNVFNVDYSTLMLVLCYDHPILTEWYAIRDNYTRTFDLATWSADRGLILRTQKSLYARRNNMFGERLRVASVHESPFFLLENNKISGFLGLLLMELSRVMNFTMEILDPAKAYGSWSHHEKKWTGVIGQLVYGMADIGVSEFTITSGRLNVVDFTLPLIHSRNLLYFKQPTGANVQWSGYFRTFSSGIWLTLVMIIITSSILLTVMKKRCFSINLISENYIQVWGIYCQQGLSEFPNESSMRLAFFSIYISSLVILSAYSASLISFLTLTTASLPFSTLEGYVMDGTYKLIVMRNTAEYDQRANTSIHIRDPVFRKMYDLLEYKELLPLTVSDGFKQICKWNNLAFYTTEVFKEAMDIYLPCKIVQIESGRSDSLAMGLTKGNPYRDFINHHLRQFQDNGVINKLKNRFLLKNNSPMTHYDAVSLKDIAPTLTVVTGGIILALFVLIMEKGFYILKTRFKNNKSVKKSSLKLQKLNNEKDLNNMRLFGYWP